MADEEVIQKGLEAMSRLKYNKSVEEALQKAVQEKNKENILAVLQKIETEKLPIDVKMLNEAKNALAKIK